MAQTKYKRVLLKLSGETFLGKREYGIDPIFCQWLAKELIKAQKTGTQLSVVFAGGTGNPFFTTDTTAALRALETKCQIILKGTKVDAVYDKDPKVYKDAKKLENLTFKQALTDKQIEVLDNNAISLCMEHKIPILVFD